MSDPTTRESILDAARELVQVRGYHAFSYRDLSQRVGIKTASIHYHFPSKSDLGLVLMAEYRANFRSTLDEIRRGRGGAPQRLWGFVELFRDTFTDGDRLCLCGSLAADLMTLPESIRTEVRGFFEDSEGWLMEVLREGVGAGELELDGSVGIVAETFLAALEGAMLGARAFGASARSERAGRWLLDTLAAD